MKAKSGLRLRAGRPEDAVACGTICFEGFRSISGRHNFPPDFPQPEIAIELASSLLARPDVFSVVAEQGGVIVGSNFLWEGDPIMGVGPITVSPQEQDTGVGRGLMQAVLDRATAQRAAGVRLCQAAYHNRSLALYTKLGFAAREPLSVIQGPPSGRSVAGYAVRGAGPKDREGCLELCRTIHGHARSSELDFAIAQGAATLVEHDGRIVGYSTGVGFLGHSIALNNEGLKALIGAAELFAGPGFLLPTRNHEMMRWCLAHGLSIVQPMTLMSLGLYQEPAGAFLPSVVF